MGLVPLRSIYSLNPRSRHSIPSPNSIPVFNHADGPLLHVGLTVQLLGFLPTNLFLGFRAFIALTFSMVVVLSWEVAREDPFLTGLGPTRKHKKTKKKKKKVWVDEEMRALS